MIPDPQTPMRLMLDMAANLLAGNQMSPPGDVGRYVAAHAQHPRVRMSGPLALVGGAEFTPAVDEIDRLLLELTGAAEVLVLPTAAAFEHPERAVANAVRHFGALGVTARGLPLLTRSDAHDPANAEALRSARFVYLAGGSPMHLKSVLKDTPAWEAIVAGHAAGAGLAGSSAGAMVLTDPMTDPRGGAFTLGLGLLSGVAVVPHAESWSHDRLRRTLDLGKGFALLVLHSGAAAIRLADGTWRAVGEVSVHRDGHPADLSSLP
jgi:cyanophycinase